MTDDEVILEAERIGFKFHKRKDSWTWSVIDPDKDDSVTCEQGDPKGMKWLREKLTHYMDPPVPK